MTERLLNSSCIKCGAFSVIETISTPPEMPTYRTIHCAECGEIYLD